MVGQYGPYKRTDSESFKVYKITIFQFLIEMQPIWLFSTRDHCTELFGLSKKRF